MNDRPLGIQCEESMRGFLAPGVTDFHQGYAQGREAGLEFTLHARITIADVDAFVNLTHRTGVLEGTVDYAPLGRGLKIEDGIFQLFTLSPAGERRMIYRFRFAGPGGTYCFEGYKLLVDEPWKFDLVEDMTQLFSRIDRDTNGDIRPHAAGIIRFDPLDAPALLQSLKALNAPNRTEALRARVKFLSFVYRDLRNEYCQNLSFLYWTGYENLVLAGRCARGPEKPRFFFFSGAHDLGFPWGDGATFWDLVLVLEHPDGSRDRYLAADIVLEGLRLDVERGVYRYEGTLYRLTRGHRVSFLDDIRREDPILEKTWGRIELRFDAHPFSRQNLMFPFKERGETEAGDHVRRVVQRWLPHLNSLGIKVRPHRVDLVSGAFTVGHGGERRTWIAAPSSAFGEAEIAEFTALKEPTLQYNYQCGINPRARRAHVRIRAGVWRNDRHLPLKDGIDRLLAPMVDMAASRQWLITDEGFQSGPYGAEPEPAVTDPDVLEINYEHYSTANQNHRHSPRSYR
ncbi:MAG: hypothetical protein IBX71_01620 [Candidatus Desulforudis sp.]|nr:hypothetical protein [Desulforudis sp.]